MKHASGDNKRSLNVWLELLEERYYLGVEGKIILKNVLKE
jgi:hypothetical protein